MEHTLTTGSMTGDRPRPVKNYLNESSGLWSWLTTLDHKRIGIMYFVTVMFFFLIGGIMALLLRLELFSANSVIGAPFLSNLPDVIKGQTNPADLYNRIMTYHGAITVFMVIVPGIP